MIVREHIEFERGLDSKDSLGVGEIEVKKQQIGELLKFGVSVDLYNYYENWGSDSFLCLDHIKIEGDHVKFKGSYLDHDGNVLFTSGKCTIKNMEEIFVDENDPFITLEEPEAYDVAEDYDDPN